jgi:hypothetical protein
VQREWERIMQAQQRIAAPKGTSQGGTMSSLRNRYSILVQAARRGLPRRDGPRSWREWIDEHPFLSMWAILAVGMVAIFLITARNVDLLPTQRLFMAVACVALAGLCTWVVSWE